MPKVLQICPNDHPPFQTICRNHAVSLGLLGYEVDSVFLNARAPEPLADAEYLLADQRQATEMLRSRARQRDYSLILTHRFRGYSIGEAIRPDSALQIAVAHEFGMFSRASRRLRQRFHRQDVMFAGVSSAVADDLLRSLPRLGEVEVIPNSLNLDEQALASRVEARAALGIAADCLAVGVVGRLHRKKNPLLALDGFNRARDRLPRGATLVFVGDGELESAIAAKAADQVLLLGARPNAARLMTAFDLLLVASSDREAFGMTLVEAMAAGTPVVCADRAGPRGVLGELGVYFDGDDASNLAQRLIEAAADLDRLQDRTRRLGVQRVAERFSTEALARRFRECLRRRSP